MRIENTIKRIFEKHLKPWFEKTYRLKVENVYHT